jgi:hypothetical protein
MNSTVLALESHACFLKIKLARGFPYLLHIAIEIDWENENDLNKLRYLYDYQYFSKTRQIWTNLQKFKRKIGTTLALAI